VYVKDEGRNPTGTVLDRGLSVALTAVAARAAEGQDVEPLACESPRNAGQSMAAYAGRADLRSYAFVPSRCAFSNKAMTNVHGGDMRVVGGRFPDAADAVDEQLETDYTDLGEFVTPYRHDGVKTLAFELVADLDAAPDVVIVPTGSGEVVAGIYKGFSELERVGAIDDVPKIVAAQAAGCVRRSRPRSNATSTSRSRGRRPTRSAASWRIADPGGAAAVEAVRERRYRCGRRGR